MECRTILQCTHFCVDALSNIRSFLPKIVRDLMSIDERHHYYLRIVARDVRIIPCSLSLIGWLMPHTGRAIVMIKPSCRRAHRGWWRRITSQWRNKSRAMQIWWAAAWMRHCSREVMDCMRWGWWMVINLVVDETRATSPWPAHDILGRLQHPASSIISTISSSSSSNGTANHV